MREYLGVRTDAYFGRHLPADYHGLYSDDEALAGGMATPLADEPARELLRLGHGHAVDRAR